MQNNDSGNRPKNLGKKCFAPKMFWSGTDMNLIIINTCSLAAKLMAYIRQLLFFHCFVSSPDSSV